MVALTHPASFRIVAVLMEYLCRLTAAGTSVGTLKQRLAPVRAAPFFSGKQSSSLSSLGYPRKQYGSLRLHGSRKVLSARASLDPSHVEQAVRAGAGSVQNILFTIADAATDLTIQVAASSVADAASSATSAAADVVGAPAEAATAFVKQSDWLSGLADGLEGVLKVSH